MNPVLEEIVSTGLVRLPGGERVPVSSHIDPSCGSLLQRMVAEAGPTLAVEVGLAFGISTLYLLEALRSCGGRLIGMDPAQFDASWRGGGLANIERAGFGDLYEFHESPSQLTLPALEARGEKVDLGFIDGWHTFDHALVDFFYIDRMLRPGGIVMFDDVGYPSIRRICEFVLANRDYEIAGAVRYAQERSAASVLKHVMVEFLRPLYRTDKTPDAATRTKLEPLGDVRFLALRKLGDDLRRWDHFIPF